MALAYQAEPGETGVAPESDSNEVVEVGMLEMFEEKEKLMSIMFDVKEDGCRVLQKNSVHFSMVVHGEAEFGANDDIRLGLLCLKSHNPDVRVQLMPEDMRVEQRLANEARHVASSRAAPRARKEG